jgi:hypothetical protein
MRSALVLALVVAGSVVPLCARAQDNSAAVESLFDEGRKLAATGDYAAACPKFLASYNLEHRVGTLLNLADCYERNGRVASAWARFVEARALAARSNQQERVDFAAQHAADLEPRRSMLTILVPNPSRGLVVKRDGVVVDEAVFGVAVPVDGGSHTIEATAPDKEPLTDSLTLRPESDSQTYTLPALADIPKEIPAAGDAATQPGGTNARAIVGLTLAGVGVVGAGIGAYFGVAALSKNSDSTPYCNVGGMKDNCWGPGVTYRNDAVSDATISTVLVSVGAAAIVGGVVLWITTHGSSATATIGIDGRMVRVAVSF